MPYMERWIKHFVQLADMIPVHVNIRRSNDEWLWLQALWTMYSSRYDMYTCTMMHLHGCACIYSACTYAHADTHRCIRARMTCGCFALHVSFQLGLPGGTVMLTECLSIFG